AVDDDGATGRAGDPARLCCAHAARSHGLPIPGAI
ncbi:MAG: hypothetical protein AVDCRST_MAG26-1071, partial [uncultured Chloroflexia bacterium]